MWQRGQGWLDSASVHIVQRGNNANRASSARKASVKRRIISRLSTILRQSKRRASAKAE
jgi:hypothetical protein